VFFRNGLGKRLSNGEVAKRTKLKTRKGDESFAGSCSPSQK
jgi:hypothetical protein